MDPLRFTHGDTRPALTFELEQDGTPITDAASAKFRLKKPNGTITEVPLTLSEQPTRTVATGYFGVGDLDQTGEMQGEIVLVYDDGRTQTSEDPIPVIVRGEFAEGVSV